MAQQKPKKKNTSKKSSRLKNERRKVTEKKSSSKKRLSATASAGVKKKSKPKVKTKAKAPAPAPSKNGKTSKPAQPAKKTLAAVKEAPVVKTKAMRPITAAKSLPVEPKVISPPKRISKSKMLSRNFLIDLAQAIKTEVAPILGETRGREIVGSAVSGDATFELDRVAEKALMAFLKSARMPVAYYSEDSGYTTFTSGQPANLLVVDPVDGSRAAKCGFEGCVVSVCSTRVIERPVCADIDNACVMELCGGRVFYAEKDGGARLYEDGHTKKIRLSDNSDLESVAWSMTVPARPAELIFPTAAKLIDLSSLKGGFFACNSTSFSLTRLLTGQLDACVDFANRYYRDIPRVVEDTFINAGRGTVLGVCPYDFAAAMFIAKEAGCFVTDAYGKNFDEVLMLDSSVSNHRSLIAASNRALHDKLYSFFNTRIHQYETLLKRRTETGS